MKLNLAIATLGAMFLTAPTALALENTGGDVTVATHAIREQAPARGPHPLATFGVSLLLGPVAIASHSATRL